MKKSVLLSIIGVLLVVGVGITFAYFTSGVEVSGDGSTVELQPGDMIKVTYDAGDNSLSSNNLVPGQTLTKTFTVTVTPTSKENTASYSIYLDLTDNTFVKCDDSNYNSITNACIKDYEELTYEFKDNTGATLSSGNLIGESGRILLAAQTKTVDKETTYEYTMEITFHETNADQNHNMDKVLNGSIEVEFYFETMSEQIENLYTDNSTILAYDETVDNNLRYIGADPNNYVYFNCADYNNPSSSTCELWRIIGVFNENSHGRSGEKLVKLIRSDSLGRIAWDSAYTNNWSTASLQKTLNGDYLNGSGSYASSGIKNDTTRNMIANVTWKLGGSSTNNDVTASMFYERERGTTVYSGRPTTWQGEIALMYPSDYGYATSGGSTTNREACLAKKLYNWYSSSYSDCKNNDWIFNNDYQWTLTPYSRYSNGVVNVYSTGCVYLDGYTADYSYGVRPSVYLTSNVSISGGDGTMNNPYILKA